MRVRKNFVRDGRILTVQMASEKKRTETPSLENLTDSSKIVGMDFGFPRSELMPGARNAVETCLGVQRGEHVALIADEASRAVAASIAAAVEEQQAQLTGLLLEDLGPRPMAAAPSAVLSALET